MRGVARLAAALAALTALLAPRPAVAEAIRNFAVELFLEDGGDFVAVEHIAYDFGPLERHGILREIPLRGGDGFGPLRGIGIEVQEVTDAAQKPLTWDVDRSGSRITIRVGDADRTISGLHEYVITYRVRRAFNFADAADELAWNVTGDEWKVPIERAEARIYLPPRGGAGRVALRCFSGPHGSTRRDCELREEGSTVLVAADALAPGAGLTAVVTLPKGVLLQPSAAALALAWLSENGGGWLLLPLAVFAALYALWRARGRDQGASDAIAVRYEAPEGLTPAEVGTLLDERADLSDLTATILDLAVRGYLDLQEEESERFLHLGRSDFLLLRKRPADDALKAHERALFDALFASGDVVRVSSLRRKFYDKVPGIQQALYDALSGPEACFAASPETVRRRYRALGAVAIGAAFFAGSLGLHLALLAPWSIAGSGVLALAFSRAMPCRTRHGRALYEQILGFREFLSRVDRDRLERLGERQVDRFEKVLPFAIVLGAADAWSDAFSDLYQKPPSWYRSTRYNARFDPHVFVSDLGRSLHSIGASLNERPPRSGGSGGGGGGFSGGGFGGGGGGSW